MSQIGTAPLATGATDEQIEAAFQRIAGPDHDPEYDPDSDFYVRDELRRYARDLVPPGFVISPATAVVGDAERAAIGKAYRVFDDMTDEQRFNYGITPADIAILTSLLGRTGEGDGG